MKKLNLENFYLSSEKPNVTHCEKHGDGVNYANFDCFKCEQENSIQETIKRDREDLIDQLIKNSCLITRFSLDDFKVNDEQKARIDSLIFRQLKNKTPLIFSGLAGTGKTWASCYAIRKVIQDYTIPCFFVSESKIDANIKDWKFKLEIKERIDQSKYIVIDDFLSVKTEETRLFIESLIYQMYNDSKAYILTTNVPKNKIKNEVNERIFSRLSEGFALTFTNIKRENNNL